MSDIINVWLLRYSSSSLNYIIFHKKKGLAILPRTESIAVVFVRVLVYLSDDTVVTFGYIVSVGKFPSSVGDDASSLHSVSEFPPAR